MNWEEFKSLIIDSLSDDLLSKEYQKVKKNKEFLPNTFGHCYVASEAAYYLLGGKSEGWKAYHVKHLGYSHWFLKHESGFILDITANQFKASVNYERARGTGFLTKLPSKRAQILIKKIAVSPTWKLLKIASP